MSEPEKPKDGFRDPGLRSARTTSLFRVVNFELFVKPNKYVMGFGIAAMSLSAAYLLYLNMQASEDKRTYAAINDDGTRSLRVKTSKWD